VSFKSVVAERLRHPGTGPNSSLDNDPSDFWMNTNYQTPVQYDGDPLDYLAPFTGPTSVAYVPQATPLPQGETQAESAGSSPVSTGSAVPTQVLYFPASDGVPAISVNDIFQGQMGDCYLCSSIGELALFQPSWITQMIQANANGTETVTLYEAANGSLPTFGTTSFTAVGVNVTNSFPSYAVNNGATQDVINGQKAIWVQVLEKAYANLNGGYGIIGDGGWPVVAMEELTGCPATSYTPGSVSAQQLQSATANGDLICFDTLQGSGQLAYGMYADHAYMFQSLSTVNGTVMVNLLNPWGFDQPNPIPLSQIGSVCAEIDIDQFTNHTVVDTGPLLAQQTADQTWKQGSKVSMTLAAGTFTDPLGETLTYTATQASGQALPSWLSFKASTMTLSGTVPGGMENLSLSVTATDTSGLSGSETFQVTVPAAAPTLAHQTETQTWTEGTQLSFTLPSNTFADPNSEALTYTAGLSNGQALPSWLTLNRTSATFSGSVPYTSGPISIKLTAADTSGLSVSETFTATLAAPAPTVTDQTANQSWTAGQAVSFALASDTFTTVPGQTLKYTATLPAGLTINALSGLISGTVPFLPATDTIKVTGTQTNGLSASETFKATINAAAPTVSQTPDQAWTANQPVSLSLAAVFADPQGETLTYTVGGLPSGLSFNAKTLTISGTPLMPGTSAIKVTAKDQSGLSTSETFHGVVTATAPTVSQTPDQAWTANQPVSLSLAAAFADPQGETMTYTVGGLPSGLSFNAKTLTISGTPLKPATSAITVTAKDQSGLSASETFHGVVTATAPTLADQTANQVFTDGQSMKFLLPSNTFTDPQGAALTFTAFETSGANQTSWMTFNPNLDEFLGTPPASLTGTIGVHVVATDAYGLSTSETFGVAFAPSGSHLTAVGEPIVTEMLAFHH
jgi:trimeric autotransporter adhesin